MNVLPLGHRDPVCVIAGVDTLSDVNLCVRDLLSNVHTIVPDFVRGSSGLTPFTEEGLLHVWINGSTIFIPALVATADNLPHQCQALLGVPAIDDLGISLDAQKQL